jgi:hypothetical protein
VEEMACAERGARIARVEQAVSDVGRPRGESNHHWKPDREAKMGRPCEGQCPNDRDGRRVEARQMPEMKRGRDFPDIEPGTRPRWASEANTGPERGGGGHSLILRRRGSL